MENRESTTGGWLAGRTRPSGRSAGSESSSDSPLRVILAVTPEKKIMYNAALANRHMAGTVSEAELGPRLESDAGRMNRERNRRGLRSG